METSKNTMKNGHINLVIGGSGSGETNALLNSIKEEDDIDKNYLCAKDLSETNMDFDQKT